MTSSTRSSLASSGSKVCLVFAHMMGAPSEAVLILVRAAGILFTKINLDTYGAVYDDAFADLAAALENASMLHALVAPGRHDSESALLKLTVMIVFSLREANNDPTVVHARYAH